MQIKSLANKVLARNQLARIQQKPNRLNDLSSSMTTRSSTVASRFQALQKALQDDQHDVYATGAGPVVDSDITAPSTK